MYPPERQLLHIILNTYPYILLVGESFRSLGFSYRVGERTISNIVTETCCAIFKELRDTYMKVCPFDFIIIEMQSTVNSLLYLGVILSTLCNEI